MSMETEKILTTAERCFADISCIPLEERRKANRKGDPARRRESACGRNADTVAPDFDCVVVADEQKACLYNHPSSLCISVAFLNTGSGV